MLGHNFWDSWGHFPLTLGEFQVNDTSKVELFKNDMQLRTQWKIISKNCMKSEEEVTLRTNFLLYHYTVSS